VQPIPTWWFVLVVVRRAGRYLLVQERKFGQSWYVPAGRVDPGEDVCAAARRETREETGIEVELDGVLAVEHLPAREAQAARLRLWLTAHPLDPAAEPKQRPDAESLGARWVALAELPRYPLRAPELRSWLQYVDAGGAVAPVNLLRLEGAPHPDGTRPGRPPHPEDSLPQSAAGPQRGSG